MGDDMASDWLAAALAECLHMTDAGFAAGCAAARRDCTHHGKIIPTVLRVGQERDKATAPDPFLKDWHNAMAQLAGNAKQITHERGGTVRLADVLKRIEAE